MRINSSCFKDIFENDRLLREKGFLIHGTPSVSSV